MEEIIDRLKKVAAAPCLSSRPLPAPEKALLSKKFCAATPTQVLGFGNHPPTREGEVDGVDYYFITDKQYDEFLAQDAFY